MARKGRQKSGAKGKGIRAPIVEGPATGVCNICGEDGPLTQDHTPPKGAVDIRPVKLKSIVGNLADGEPNLPSSRILQNGIRYRSLCSNCNNNILGAKYDQSYIDFVKAVRAYANTSIEIPNPVRIDSTPQKLMRAVLGHMCAQGVERYRKGPDTEPIRDYLLDDSLPLPENIRIYAWPYLDSRQLIVRDAAYLDLTSGQPFIFWLTKFSPIAFMATFDQPQDLNLFVPELSIWRHKPIDHVSRLALDLKNIKHPYWPEAPGDTTVLTYGEAAITVESHLSSKKKKSR